MRHSAFRRITPADAGKTTQATTSSPNAPDHPRGCGENDDGDISRLRDIGSPPRMRGKHAICYQSRHAGRITPADAGKTLLPDATAFCTKDHPRGCGENIDFYFSATAIQGSPPRMRGKQGYRPRIRVAAGITPADAGKTTNYKEIITKKWDHPRGCGENDEPCGSKRNVLGSPPRMRGKH